MKQRLVFTTSIPFIKAEKSIFKIKDNFNFENFKVLSAKNSCCFSAEIIVENISLNDEINIRKFCNDQKIDINMTIPNVRFKKLLLADMDSTIIKEETFDELSKKSKNHKKIVEITRLGMEGKISFKDSFNKRVKLLGKLNNEIIEDIKFNLSFNSGAEKLINTMNNQGAFCYLVSSGLRVFTNYVCKKINFFSHFGNKIIENSYFDGEVIDEEQKLNILNSLCKKHSLSPLEVISVGDGANDLKMLSRSGIGISFNGKEILRKKLKFQINHSNLKSLLFIQGYKEIG